MRYHMVPESGCDYHMVRQLGGCLGRYKYIIRQYCCGCHVVRTQPHRACRHSSRLSQYTLRTTGVTELESGSVIAVRHPTVHAASSLDSSCAATAARWQARGARARANCSAPPAAAAAAAAAPPRQTIFLEGTPPRGAARPATVGFFIV